jgi:hypothetical protein
MRRATGAILILVPVLLVALIAPAGAADGPRRFVAYELAQARRATLAAAAARAPHPARMPIAGPAAPAAVSAARARVRSVQQISRQNVPPQPGSQPDTQAEPDIAVDPKNPAVVVAVFQQGRFEEGGSVATGFAWSHDRGRSWRDGALPNLTTAVGGEFPRASDPVVAFGPDHAVYAQTLVVDRDICRSGVAVQRSEDGGRSFGDPVLVQDETDCNVLSDKNWITVDTFPRSPHYGRIYSVWTRYTLVGAPAVLRYSDDRGRTWSRLLHVSASTSLTASVQPVVRPTGDLVVAYIDFTSQEAALVVSRSSRDGGVHFGRVRSAGPILAGEPPDMRTGRFISTTVDRRTGRLFTVWQDVRFRRDGLTDIIITASATGERWSRPRRVNTDASTSRLDHFTPDVAALGGKVFVNYYTRSNRGGPSDKVNQRYIDSEDNGVSFDGELTLGPPGDLDFAALAPGKFLGDYIGLAASPGRVQAVWCRPSQLAGRRFHQTTWSATIRPES